MFLLFFFFVKIGLLNGENLPQEKPISGIQLPNYDSDNKIQLLNYDSDIKLDTVMNLNYELFYNCFFRLS